MFLGIDTSAFMPHGHCILWKPALLFPIVLSEVMIFFSYTSIPVAIYIFHRNRPDLDADSRKILILFFFFIQLCGITHLISAYNYWNSAYVLAMFLKVATAIVSVMTAITLFSVLPKLIKLPSPQEHLKLIAELKTLNSQLEEKVQERTARITEQNNLLETLVEGYRGSILKYEPKIENGKIIDFRSSVVFGKAASEAGLTNESQIVGESVKELFPEVLENGHFDAAIDAFCNNKQVIEDPVYNKALDKYFRVVNFKKPDIDFLLVYFTDVTQRETLKLDAINNSKLISLGELSGGIAHEINSPLQIINSSAQLLERSIDLEDHLGKKCLSNIYSTVSRINDIISNLKRLSRNDSGQFELVDIDEVVRKAVQFYEQRIKLKDITLTEVYQSKSNNLVKTIELNVFQIINNLLSNAIDALKKKTSGDKSLTIRVEQDNNDIVLEVSNNGPSIPDDIENRIFEPLFTTKDVGEGTGLGLSLSKRLAEEIGAELSLTQSDDTVSFVLRIRNVDENSHS